MLFLISVSYLTLFYRTTGFFTFTFFNLLFLLTLSFFLYFILFYLVFSLIILFHYSPLFTSPLISFHYIIFLSYCNFLFLFRCFNFFFVFSPLYLTVPYILLLYFTLTLVTIFLILYVS